MKNLGVYQEKKLLSEFTTVCYFDGISAELKLKQITS